MLRSLRDLPASARIVFVAAVAVLVGLTGVIEVADPRWLLVVPVCALAVMGGVYVVLTRDRYIRSVLTRRLVAAATNTTPGLTHTARQIRDEYAGQVLTEARQDPGLDALLDQHARHLAVRLARHDEYWSDPRQRPIGIVLFMNALLSAATEPGQRIAAPTYADYSPLALNLAAACRLLDDQALLRT